MGGFRSRKSGPSWWASGGLAVVGLLVAGTDSVAQEQSQPRAILLREIKDLDKLDPNWIMGICNLPGLACNKVEEPKLYERKTQQGRTFYAVMPDRVIAYLSMKGPGQWQLLHRWDFATYPLPSGAADQDAKLEIHPALYPVAPETWAVAVLERRTEGYSGGGAEFVTADFVALAPNITNVREEQRRFGAVPFSCRRTVRACFTEKDYKTLPRCHDASSGHLTLKFTGTSAKRSFDWTATWNQAFLAAAAPETDQTRLQQTIVLKPGQPSMEPGTFAFCGDQ